MHNGKLNKSLASLTNLFLCLLLFAASATSAYGSVVAGYSEYYIPGDEWNMNTAFTALDNYSPGTVAVTNGSTAVTGTGTTFTRLRGGQTVTIAGIPCIVSSVTSNTVLTLTSGYTGATSGSALYRIPMHSMITVTAWSDNTTVYYDHWENGYGFDPANPATADEKYTLVQGQSIAFESGSIGLPRSVGTPPAPNSICNNYRNRTLVSTGVTTCYDGGDRIYVAGGVATVTRGIYIEGVGIGTQATAWEIYPVKPQLTTYVLSFGENQGFFDFERVFVLVQATEDNTTVTVDLNGDGVADILNQNRDANWNTTGPGTVSATNGSPAVVGAGTTFTTSVSAGQPITIAGVEYVVLSVTNDTNLTLRTNYAGATAGGLTYIAGDGSTIYLNKGQTFLLDSTSACLSHANCTTFGVANQLPAGTVVKGSATLQVKYIAGNMNENAVARGFSAFPRGYWTKDYYAPFDQPSTAGIANTDYYLYNPNASAITVTWESRTTSGSFSVPAGSTVSYRTATGGSVPVDSGLYFKGTDVFWGVGVGDAGDHLYEWGFSLLPSTMLFKEHFLGWAPDSNNTPANSAPLIPVAGRTDMGIFLTVAQDNTTVFVDYDNNGTVDQTYRLDRLQTQFIADPDGDLTQAHFWATGPFTMAYGQNADTAATPGPPGGIDLGYVAIPATDFVSLVLGVNKSVAPQVVPTASGSVATFTIKVDSQKYTIDGVNVTDYLPPNWQYLVGTDTATITWPDLTTHVTDPTVSGAPSTGQTLTWTSAQLGTNGTPGMDLNQEVMIVFTARTTAVLASGTLSQNRVKAVGTRLTGTPEQQTFTATDSAFVSSGDLILTKTSNASVPLYPGNQFTYTVQATTSAGTFTRASLFDPIPAGTTYVAGSGQVTCRRINQNVRDEFATVAYTNNGPNNTANWAANWTETDILAGGAATGLARVLTDGRLRLTNAENVRDEFATVAYTNNGPNNTANWAANWVETDAISGGATGAASGYVQIRNDKLQFAYLSNVRDEFTATGANSYAGNNGSANWAGSWTEENDAGTPDYSSGTIRLNDANDRVEFLVSPVGAAIRRDATVTGATFANIGFTLTDFGIDAGETMIAEYMLDNGGIWINLGTYDGGTAGWSGVPQTFTVALSGNNTLTLRFRVGGNAYDLTEAVYLDNVDIAINAAPPTASIPAGTQVERRVNLSAAANAMLTFDYSSTNLEAGDTLVVEVNSNGAGWNTLQTFSGSSSAGTYSFDITAYRANTTWVRFRVTGGFNDTGEAMYFDNVDISYKQATTATAISRTANTTGWTNPLLSFGYIPVGLDAGDTFIVEASTNGAAWTTLATFTGGMPDVSPPYNLSAFVSATTYIRFRLTGGFNTTSKYILIDNVDITTLAGSGSFASGNPPDFLSSSAGCSVSNGNPITLTFNVIVDNPLAAGIDSITNTAYLTTAELPTPLSASVTNIVLNPASQSASVGDSVWLDSNGNRSQDVGEPGLANVEVTLKDQYGVPVMTTTTDSTGHYLFTGATPGTGYYVEVTGGLPAGLTQTAPAGHSDNRTNAFNLTAGQSYMNADLGYKPASGTATIGNTVWSDANGSGTRDAGEPGIAGVTVKLYKDVNSNGIFEPGTDTLCTIGACGTNGTTVTAPGGSYLFTGVTANGADDYFVYVDPAQAVLSGYTRTAPANDSLLVNNLNPGDVVTYANFGYRNPSNYSITDRVWFDNGAGGGIAGDGIQNGSEPGISGVTVALLDASSNTIATTTTGANGNFTFSGVIGGGADYKLKITDTNGVLASYYGTTAIAVAGSEAINNVNGNIDHSPAPHFGYYTNNTIGSWVYNDANNNNTHDSGEAGFSNVTAKLYRDINGNSVIDPPTLAGPGTVAVTNGSATVTGTGTSFLNYHAGELLTILGVRYTIQSISSNTSLTLSTSYAGPTQSGLAYNAPQAGAGTVATTINSSAVVGTGTTFTNFSAGDPITINNVPYTILSVTDNTHLTLTSNAGATASGLAYFGPSDYLVRSVTTDANGQYLFSGVPNGRYIVSIENPPGGYTFTGTDSDGATTGQQRAVTMAGANSLSIDFGYRAAANRSVSGRLWNDASNDGVIDGGETGMAGVTIELLQGGSTVATTTSAADGTYSFNGLPSGNYTVRITDNTGVLSGYMTTYEKTEGTTGSFNGQEAVDLTGGNQTGVNFGYLLPAGPTRVVLSYFSAHVKDGQVVVKWETVSEHNTLGFHLMRLDSATGDFVDVSTGLLPALHTHRMGGTYTLIDSGAHPGETYEYILVEVERSGRQIAYGPYTVAAEEKAEAEPLNFRKSSAGVSVEGDSSSTSGYSRKVRRQSELQETRLHELKAIKAASRISTAAAAPAGSRIKIPIRENGLYFVNANDISRLLGLTSLRVTSMIARNQLSVSNQGKPVSYLPAPGNAGIYFYGTGTDSVYTRDNVYWIDTERGSVMASETGRKPLPASGKETFTETLHIEKDLIQNMAAGDPAADYWAWDLIYMSPAWSDGPKKFKFTLKGKADTDEAVSTLRVRLAGGSDSGIKDDHHVKVSLNGQQIGEGKWSGLDTYTLVTSPFSQSLLTEGENTIELTGVLDGNKGIPFSMFWIDSFDLTYERLYSAEGNRLYFTGDGNPLVTVGGFATATPDILLFNITDPLKPRLNTATTIDGSAGSYRLSVNPVSSDARYLAVARDSVVKAGNGQAVIPSKLRLNHAADYLIIVPAELSAAAQPLADYRRAQGLGTMIVTVDEIMNEFNFGLSSPEAIRQFLTYAHKNWRRAPRYVVLVGGGTWDYRDNKGKGGNLIPPVLVTTPYGLATSDNHLADVNGDRVPDMAIGRLPVLTVQELKDVINKIKTFESRRDNRVILLADIPDEDGDFTADSEAVAGLFPRGYVLEKVYMADHTFADAGAMLSAYLNGGSIFFNYVGHAAFDSFSKTAIFANDRDYYPDAVQVDSLLNRSGLPVMVAMTCIAGEFAIPGYQTLSESMVLKPDGGAVAVWSATGLSDDAQAGILNAEFYKAIFRGGKKTLGDAVLQAIAKYRRSGSMPFMMDIYTILGDPALRIR